MRLLRAHDLAAVVVLAVSAAVFYGVTYSRSSYSYILRADEGVSFATSTRVTQGFVPQRDFPSYYGPIMPYVYGAAFKAFGPSLALMRGIWALFYIVSILLFYWIGRFLLPSFAAFAGAAMLIGQQHTPLYTYNHIGFVLATEAMLLLLLLAISGKKPAYFRTTLGALLLLALLIKFNEAFVVFIVFVIVLWIRDGVGSPGVAGETLPRSIISRRDILIPGIVALGAFGMVTTALNAGLTKFQFLRNFPLLPQYQASIGGYQYLKLILAFPFKTGWGRMTAQDWYFLWYENYLFAILIACVVGMVVLLCTAHFLMLKRYNRRFGPGISKAILLVGVAFATYHEFYLTGNHWSAPMYIGFGLMAFTFLIWRGLERFSRTRVVIISTLLALSVASDAYYVRVVHHNYSQFYLSARRAHIYSSPDSDAPVVGEVVEFLEHETLPGDSIAAFPHDALLIYLAGRQNAMRDDDYQWMLFPTAESDLEITKELETKKVPKVLLSNFVGIRRGEPVLFGSDYLPTTFKYLQDHYEVVRTFGADPQRYQVQYLELADSTQSTKTK